MGAICKWCNQDMMKVDDCAGNREISFGGGKLLPSIPYQHDYGDENQRCHDCNVKLGGYHHPGCDMERCPQCGGQLISCDCLPYDEDEDDDEPTDNYELLGPGGWDRG